MKLNKRDCNIRIRLTPLGTDLVRVHFRINGDNHYFFPSCVMGCQFSAFLSAIYCLYNEGYDLHRQHMRQLLKQTGVTCIKWHLPHERKDRCFYKSFHIFWDEEGRYTNIYCSRRSKTEEAPQNGVPDPISLKFVYSKKTFRYTIDGRELCYAIAKGYTEAIKKYGIQGYLRSTGSQDMGDFCNLEELLFVKAYALGAMETRELNELWQKPKSRMSADASSFEKELELLLFDM